MDDDGAAFPLTCGSMGIARPAASFSRSSLDPAEPRPDLSAAITTNNHDQGVPPFAAG